MSEIRTARQPTTTAMVGDLGGTHARLALVDLADPALRSEQALTLQVRDHINVEQAIAHYLAQVKPALRPTVITLAVAGPVSAGSVRFTNSSWHCSESGLRSLGFSAAKLVNDFEALAHAAPLLQAQDLRSLGGPQTGLADGTIVVLGPGTGFGVSVLVRDATRRLALATEAGHASFAPANELEQQIHAQLWQEFGRVTIETLLSGPGLQNIYSALCRINGQDNLALSPPEVTQRARAGDTTARHAVTTFCAVLGSIAGDAALTYGARGGVYVTGGVADTLSTELQNSDFRARFDDKGRHRDYVSVIPSYLITRNNTALLGAAAVARGLT